MHRWLKISLAGCTSAVPESVSFQLYKDMDLKLLFPESIINIEFFIKKKVPKKKSVVWATPILFFCRATPLQGGGDGCESSHALRALVSKCGLRPQVF